MKHYSLLKLLNLPKSRGKVNTLNSLSGLLMAALILVGLSWSSRVALANPAAPINVEVISASGKGVTLYWNYGSEPLGNSGSRIERSTGSAAGPWLAIGKATIETSFDDLDLTPNTTYYYRIIAYDNTGDSPPSFVVNATIGGVPAAPTNLQVTTTTGNSVAFSWNDNSDDEDHFEVEQSASAGGPWIIKGYIYPQNNTTYTVTGLNPATTYFFRVKAYNLNGGSSPSNTVNPTTPAEVAVPSAPADPVAITASPASIKVTWSSVSTNERGFLIERSLTPAGPWLRTAKINRSDSTAYVDSGLEQGTTYYYRLSAFNNLGYSAASGTVSATTTAPTTPPQSPYLFFASIFSSNRAQLDWLGDNEANALGYRIERSNSSNGPWTVIDTLYPGNIPTDDLNSPHYYNDYGLVPDKQYYYRVQSYNAVGSSDYSDVSGRLVNVSAPPSTPGSLTATATSPSSINLTWVDTASNETGFIIQRSHRGTAGSWEFKATTITTPNATSFTDSGLTSNTTYFYRVIAIHSYNLTSVPSGPASATVQDVQLKAPLALAAMSVSTTAIDLVWADGNASKSGFKIERSPSGLDGSWTELVSLNTPVATTYNDSGLTPSATYYYRIKTLDLPESSSFSNVARATTGTAWVVSNNQDQGDQTDQDTSGTLSYALKRAGPGETISFGAGITTVTVFNALRPVPSGVILLGGCGPTRPSVTIYGDDTIINNSAINGLELSNPGSILFGIKVAHFGGKQIVAGSGQHRMICSSGKKQPA